MDIEQLIKKYSKGLDFLEVAAGDGRSESITLTDSVTNIAVAIPKGHGVRALYKGTWGYANNNGGVSEETIKSAIKNAKIIQKTTHFMLKDFSAKPTKGVQKSRYEKDPFEVDKKEKIQKLLEIEKEIRKDDKIKSTSLGYSFSKGKINIFNSFGTNVELEKMFSFIIARVYAKDGDKVECGYEPIGKQKGYEFVESTDFSLYQKAIDRAKRQLKAKIAPAGTFKVVMDNTMTGIFFHEAIGHACEADAILENNSVYRGMIGKKVGNEIINVYNNPLADEDSIGYYLYDDEGTKSRNLPLIKNGILTNYMHSLETANRMKVEPTGNGRREAFSTQIPRMAVIVLDKGDWDVEEMIKDTKDGIYLKGCSNGQTDPLKGDFIFEASEGTMIKNGELTDAIKGACLIGNTKDILNHIDACAKDIKMNWTASYCGKAGAQVPVQQKAPHIRLLKGLIGGQQ